MATRGMLENGANKRSEREHSGRIGEEEEDEEEESTRRTLNVKSR